MAKAKAQRQVFRTCLGDLGGTVDWSKVSTLMEDGVTKYLPAGTTIGSNADIPATGDILLDRTLMIAPINGAAASGVLKHDVVQGVTDTGAFMYNGEVISEEIEAASQIVFSAAVAAEAKTALKNITFVSNGHINS